jgi:hypothetical protein
MGRIAKRFDPSARTTLHQEGREEQMMSFTYIALFHPEVHAEVKDLCRQVIQAGSTAQSLGSGNKK